jgi:hypothetical protein
MLHAGARTLFNEVNLLPCKEIASLVYALSIVIEALALLVSAVLGENGFGSMSASPLSLVLWHIPVVPRYTRLSLPPNRQELPRYMRCSLS